MNTQLNLFPVSTEKTGAIFSDCHKYRFVLWRVWDNSLPKLMFIGLNPSTANEIKPDATITRLIGLVKHFRYGGFYMLNLFTFISAHPLDLLTCENPTFQANEFLNLYAEKSEKIVFAWGNFKQAKERSKEVINMFPGAYCLIKNMDGSPRHPLYIKSDVELIKY